MNIAVLLSGCGHIDGSEIHESVLTLLALDKNEVNFQCFAPNIKQSVVVNHTNGKIVDGDVRNTLEEASRIARIGQCLDLTKAHVKDYDALIIPGGAGVIKNLCSFATDGCKAKVELTVMQFITGFFDAKKPVGAICIAPLLVALVLKEINKSACLTLGNSAEMVAVVECLGSTHQVVNSPRDIVIDKQLKLITTPGYMINKARICDLCIGIEKCILEVINNID
jgi:enhancing lycopene biosynthesis protein 2